MNEYIISEPFTVTCSHERKITLYKEWYEGTEQNLQRIVRCMDCKHFSPTWNECDRMGYEQEGVTPDGFCAWGEPKEGE